MKLTDKEVLVLACLINGDTDKIIAEKIGISLCVVRTHLLRSIYDKLGVRSRLKAAVWAWRHGIRADGIQRNSHAVPGA